MNKLDRLGEGKREGGEGEGVWAINLLLALAIGSILIIEPASVLDSYTITAIGTLRAVAWSEDFAFDTHFD